MNSKDKDFLKINYSVIDDNFSEDSGIDLGGGGTGSTSSFDVLENYYLEKDKYLENPCGSRNVQRANLRTGKLYVNQFVHGVSGNRLPFNLTLTYNPKFKNKTEIFGSQELTNTAGKLPFKGWKFNYQQYVRKQNDKFYYYDADFMLHVFVKCQNSTNVYYDSTGQTGMLLTETLDENGSISLIEITDGKNLTLRFNARGDLFKIIDKKGATASEIIITYEEGTYNVSTVTDGADRVFAFSYDTNGNLIALTRTDLEQTQTIVEFTANASIQLEKLKYVKELKHVHYEYHADKLLINKIIDESECEQVDLQYFTDGEIGDITSSKIIDGALVEKNNISIREYLTKRRKVQNDINTNGTVVLNNVTYYYFAENGEMLYSLAPNYAQDSEVLTSVNTFFDTHTFANAKAFRGCESILTQEPVLQFTFGDNNSTSMTIGTQNSTQNSNEHEGFALESPSKALLVAKVVTTASQSAVEAGNGINQSDLAKINFFVDNTVVGSINFIDSNSIYKGTIVSIPASKNKLPIKATVINNSTQSLNVEVALYSYTGSEKREVVNVNNFDEIPTVLMGTVGGNAWYESKKCDIYFNEMPIENVEFTYRDYMLTLISYFKNLTSFTAWYNDGKNAIAGCTLDTLKYLFSSNSAQEAFGDFKCAIFQKEMNRFAATYSVIDGYNLKIVNDVMNAGTSVSTFTKLDSYFRPVTQQDENGIITDYSYDAYGNCIQQKVYYKDSTSNYITSDFTYTNGDQLASEKDYRGISTYTTTYSYDADGKLIKVTTPKNEQINYEYNSGDLLSKISNGNASNGVGYQGGLLHTCYRNGATDFEFYYDKFNEISSVKQGNTDLHQKNVVYNADGSGYITVTYGNGYLEEQHFDKYGHVNQIIKKENGTIAEKIIIIYSDNELGSNVKTLEHTDIQLSANSKLRKMVDKYGNVVYNCEYDIFGNIIELEDENNVIQSCVTDELGRLKEETITEDKAVLVTRNLSYKNASTSIINSEFSAVKIGGTEEGKIQTDYAKDSLNRPTSTTVTDGGNNGYKVSFEYYPKQREELKIIERPSMPGEILPPIYKTEVKEDGTTGYIQTVKTTDIANNVEGAYKKETITYDANGNIINVEANFYDADEVLQSTSVNSYVYDNLNRLIRENNADLGKTYLYKYELRDNLTTKVEYDYTTGALPSDWDNITSFSCNDKDRIIYKDASQVTYDGAGNITSIGGKTFNWKGSRISLASDSRGTSTIFYKDNGNIDEIVFKANNNNINFATRGFSYLNGQLYCDEPDFCKLYYVYNEQGIAGFYLSNKAACYFFKEGLYTFRKNIFGDITDIYYGSTHVASYKYDAWGNCTVENFPLEGTDEDFSIGDLNPFRYRGYYWCEALQMYHLQTRWYDPTIGRFISPDSYEYLDPETIGGLNLYAYCLNNPIMYTDPTGHSATLIGLIIGAVIGAGIGLGTAIYIDYKDDGQIFNRSVAWYDYLGAIVLGGAIGAVIGATLGSFAGMSFTASIPTYGWVNAGGILLFKQVGEIALTITGAQVLGVAGLLGGFALLSKGYGPRMGHNQYENKQIDSLCNKYKLTKEQRRILHESISGRNLSYREIEEEIIYLFFS